MLQRFPISLWPILLINQVKASFSRLAPVSLVHNLNLQILTRLPPIGSYKNYGSGPLKYPLADMLQFVLEFATTKPPSASQAEDSRSAGSSATPPPSDQPAESASEDGRWGRQRVLLQHILRVFSSCHSCWIVKSSFQGTAFWPLRHTIPLRQLQTLQFCCCCGNRGCLNGELKRNRPRIIAKACKWSE